MRSIIFFRRLRIERLATAALVLPTLLCHLQLAEAQPAAKSPPSSKSAAVGDELPAVAGDKSSDDNRTRLRTQSGPLRAASFVTADAANWTFQIVQQSQPTSIALNDVVRWGAWRTPVAGHRILLRNGSEIIGFVQKLDTKSLFADPSADVDWRSRLKLPVSEVGAVVFEHSKDAARQRELDRRIAAAMELGNEDDSDEPVATERPSAAQITVLFANGDRLTGRLVGLAQEKLSLETDAGMAAIDQSRIAALVWQPIKVATPKAARIQIWVGLRDGSRLLADSLSVDDGSAKLTLAGDVVLTTATDSITALQPIGGRVVYLSDLTAAGYRHIPFLQLPWSYERDRNVLAEPLRVGTERFLKGLGMHSASRITYDLSRRYSKFQAELAIDASAGKRGSVICRVFIDDGSGEWTSVYESPTIRGGDAAVPITVDIQKAKRISLLVDFADRGDEQDHIDWLDARLIE